MKKLSDLTEQELEQAYMKSILDENIAPEDQPLLVCIGVKAFFNFPTPHH